MREDASRQPAQMSGEDSADKADVAAGGGLLQMHEWRDFVTARQRRRRKKRIVARVEHEGRHGNARQPRLAAGTRPVIVGVAVTVQRRSDQVVEGTQRGRGQKMFAIVELRKLRELLQRLAFHGAQEVARVDEVEAGVERIVVCTPSRGAGLVAAAASLIGIDEVYVVGGAQAIAAMAYGTKTIPRVDKIVGPGGGPVNDAKLLVSRDVAIDLPAGPSEVVVAADAGVEESLIEQELAAQLEHGPDSRAFVVRVGDDTTAALDEINGYAAEHVALIGPKAEALANQIRNAGAVFVGKYAPVPAGDYATGGNHVLPTGGWSRSVGGLGIETFMKTVTVQRISQEGLELLAPTIEALAEIEGLPNHKATARR